MCIDTYISLDGPFCIFHILKFNVVLRILDSLILCHHEYAYFSTIVNFKKSKVITVN